MTYNEQLLKLNESKKKLIKEAETNGYIYDSTKDMFEHQKEQIYVIHITINTLGCGESLGKFEIYDKVFQVDESFALRALEINNLEDFMEDVLFYKVWDDDFRECNAFEEVESANWFCHFTDRSSFDGYDNIITFRFSYINTTMGNVSIIKCSPKILKEHKNIYHCTENYILD